MKLWLTPEPSRFARPIVPVKFVLETETALYEHIVGPDSTLLVPTEQGILLVIS